MPHAVTNRLRGGGFTLIELLVVIMIIGILAAVALPLYLRSVEKSRTSEALAFIAEVDSAEQAYLTQFGTYASDNGPAPTNLDGIVTPNFQYFSTNWAVSNGNGNWQATVVRNATPSSPFGVYTIFANCVGGGPAQACVTSLDCSGGTCTASALGLPQ